MAANSALPTGPGLSSPHPDRTVADFAGDIARLVDALGVE
jgi:pimeloyl-ACP methyl ester carboxylesterase